MFFHKDAPILSYRQKSLNSCCFSSLASAFANINHFKDSADISLRIKEYLNSEVGNSIHFATDMMQNKKRNQGETRVHYSLMKYKKKGKYEILENISAKLIQLPTSFFKDSLMRKDITAAALN